MVSGLELPALPLGDFPAQRHRTSSGGVPFLTVCGEDQCPLHSQGQSFGLYGRGFDDSHKVSALGHQETLVLAGRALRGNEEAGGKSQCSEPVCSRSGRGQTDKEAAERGANASLVYILGKFA